MRDERLRFLVSKRLSGTHKRNRASETVQRKRAITSKDIVDLVNAAEFNNVSESGLQSRRQTKSLADFLKHFLFRFERKNGERESILKPRLFVKNFAEIFEFFQNAFCFIAFFGHTRKRFGVTSRSNDFFQRRAPFCAVMIERPKIAANARNNSIPFVGSDVRIDFCQRFTEKLLVHFLARRAVELIARGLNRRLGRPFPDFAEQLF